MSLTPLHLALGVTGDEPLSVELVRTACETGVQERDDLDWKRALPLTADADQSVLRDRQQEELAKDIAAMANTRGGLIIYGVAEVSESTAAGEIVFVGPDDPAVVQNIRRVASMLIYPPVTSLEMTWLKGDQDECLLALEIAASTESPHLIRPKRQPAGTGFWFAVPFRNGPDTDWMPEKLIESAYRERLASRVRREQSLRDLHQELVEKTTLTAGSAAWIVVTARPENPLPVRRRLDPPIAERAFRNAWQMSWASDNTIAISAARLLRDTPIRRGLRRFSQIGTRQGRALGNTVVTRRAIAEVHFDGSVGIAVTRGGAFGPNDFADERMLATIDLDQAMLDFFSLVESVAATLGVPGDYQTRVTIEPQDRPPMLRRVDYSLGNVFYQFDEGDRVGIFHPLESVLMMSLGAAATRESMADLAEDVCNQVELESGLNGLRSGAANA